MKIGKGFTTGQYCRIEAMDPENKNEKWSLIIEENVQINDSCHIAAIEKVFLGKNVLIASNVFISDHDHGDISKDSMSLIPKERELIAEAVIISKNVWIGEGAKILKGVRIGEGAIIGAGAVVTKDIPEYSVAVGVPAKVIKQVAQTNVT
jgi:lipopolysaccharide O-acetyltransferase